MDIGTGIAIAGVWIFAGTACLSKATTGMGMALSIVVAICISIYLK